MKVEIETVTEEQRDLLQSFVQMLNAVSKDGGKKRASGAKPSWKIDKSHEGAIFSHITKWKRGETHDDHSGQHPLVHAAWRALAIAWQESSPEQRASSDSDATGYKEDVASTLSFQKTVVGAGIVVDPSQRPQGLESKTHPREASWDARYIASVRGCDMPGGN